MEGDGVLFPSNRIFIVDFASYIYIEFFPQQFGSLLAYAYINSKYDADEENLYLITRELLS